MAEIILNLSTFRFYYAIQLDDNAVLIRNSTNVDKIEITVSKSGATG
jgi:hypothetical protein